MPSLFISECYPQGDQLVITTPAVCHQCTRVLRMHPGDVFFVQDPSGTTRYHVCIRQISTQQINTNILSSLTCPIHKRTFVGMAVALPNKIEKIELIVQKLTEIGIDAVHFRPSKRSLLQDISAQKRQRLSTIVREATEQSRGWKQLEVHVSPTFPVIQDAERVLFDGHERPAPIPQISPASTYTRKKPGVAWWGIVGPEGGFTDEEIAGRGVACDGHLSLGTTVLRVETAAITASRWMKQESEKRKATSN